MTTPRSIDNYGGVFVDTATVVVPTAEQGAAYANRANEDLAQMTRTTTKAIVKFTTTATAAPTTATVTAGRSHYGTGGAQFPTVAKTATGRYTITYPTEFEDGLEEDEAVAFFEAAGAVEHLTTFGLVQCTVASNIISVAVFNSSAVASDLGGGVTIVVRAT